MGKCSRCCVRKCRSKSPPKFFLLIGEAQPPLSLALIRDEETTIPLSQLSAYNLKDWVVEDNDTIRYVGECTSTISLALNSCALAADPVAFNNSLLVQLLDEDGNPLRTTRLSGFFLEENRFQSGSGCDWLSVEQGQSVRFFIRPEGSGQLLLHSLQVSSQTIS